MRGDLNTFMAAIRMTETGSYQGDPAAVHRAADGRRYVGAYQFPEDQWRNLASWAGLGNATWRSAAAQHHVAGKIFAEFYSRYGNWDLVAAAWVGGTTSADRLVQRGYVGPQIIQNPTIRTFVQKATQNYEQAPSELPSVAPEVTVMPSGWIFPVAGENKWNPNDFLYERTAKQQAAGRTRIHAGIDIHAKKGTPFVAPVSGEVVYSKFGGKGGHQVKFKGDDGIVYFVSHLDARYVRNGQRVEAGHALGSVGNSGNAKGTSPHAHFTMKNAQGQLINPGTYLSGGNSAPNVQPVAGSGVVETRNQKADRRMQGIVDLMAGQVAGGERVDYRTIDQGRDEDQAAMQEAMQ